MKLFKTIKEYALITLGITVYVLGWTIFMTPNNLIGGGVSGIGSIIQYATNGAIKLGYTYFVVNIVLIAIALFVLGRNFGWKTIYAMVLASIGLNVFQGLIPHEIIQTLALDNGKLMCTIMGGISTGIGIAMSISQGGSTGGTDIIALIINKYRNISPGRMMLWMDLVVITSSLLFPSYTADGTLLSWGEKFTTVIYGLILTVVVSTVLDIYLAGSKQSVQLFVLSSKYKEIADALTGSLNKGVTVLDGKGWYTQQSTEVLMILIRKTDLNVVLRTIKSIDPDVFLSVSSVTGVYGRGFDAIKSGNRK